MVVSVFKLGIPVIVVLTHTMVSPAWPIFSPPCLDVAVDEQVVMGAPRDRQREILSPNFTYGRSFDWQGMLDRYQTTLNKINQQLTTLAYRDYPDSELFEYLYSCYDNPVQCLGYFSTDNTFHVALACHRELIKNALSDALDFVSAQLRHCQQIVAGESQPIDEQKCFQGRTSSHPNVHQRINQLQKELAYLSQQENRFYQLTAQAISLSPMPEGAAYILIEGLLPNGQLRRSRSSAVLTYR